MQQSPQRTAAMRLQDNFIHLAPDGSVRFFVKNPELMNGRVLALHRVNGPEDVHFPTWEMHPEGDELLIVASGSLAVEFREEELNWTEPLTPQTACIVRAGTWHRLIVHEPSVLIAITPRPNTVHAKATPSAQANG